MKIDNYEYIYILGYPGSGKSTTANKLANKYGKIKIDLDNIVWCQDKNRERKKQPKEIRNLKYEELLNMKNCIVEGVYLNEYTLKIIEKADCVIILRVSKPKQFYRLLKREYFRTDYKFSLKNFINFFKWSLKYRKDLEQYLIDNEKALKGKIIKVSSIE